MTPPHQHAPPAPAPTLFAALRHRGAARYFVGLALSMTGTWMQSLALSWLVIHELGGGGRELGLVSVFQFGPMLVLGMYAGSLSDRFDKRRLLMTTQVLLGATAAVLAYVDFANKETLRRVLVLSFLSGLASAFDTPVRRALIGDFVPKPDLPNAMSLNTGVITSSRVLGLALGGYITNYAGTRWCFLANAISYLAMMVALRGLPKRIGDADPTASTTPTTPTGGVREALEHVWRTPVLRLAILATAIVATFTFNYQLTFPLLLTNVFHRNAAGLGSLLAVTSVGSFGGAMLSANRHRATLGWFLAGCGGMGVGTSLLAVAPSFWWAAIASIPMGLGGGLLMAQLSGLLIMHSDSAMRGRVLALQSVVFIGSTPIGGPIVGAVADHYGARWATGIGGIAAIAAGLLGAATQGSVTRGSVTSTP